MCKMQKMLAKAEKHAIIYFVVSIGVSPSGKATDSDSVIPRFESLIAHQINIIRTFIQSEMGSDLLFILRTL